MNRHRRVWIFHAHFTGLQETWLTRCLRLTSDVFEVDGLPVGVEQLDDGVVVVLHSAADGSHFPLDHRHVVSRQVLTFNFTTQTN